MISLRRIFFSWLALSVSALEAASPKPGKPAKEKKFDPTTTLFATNARIITFQIEVAGGEWAALQKDNRNFSGAMDEFCLFGRALDAGEIRALYSEGKPQPDPVAAR